jgi:hypothetical protein
VTRKPRWYHYMSFACWWARRGLLEETSKEKSVGSNAGRSRCWVRRKYSWDRIASLSPTSNPIGLKHTISMQWSESKRMLFPVKWPWTNPRLWRNRKPRIIPATALALTVDVHQRGWTETTSNHEQRSNDNQTLFNSRWLPDSIGQQNQSEQRCKDGED